MRRIDKIPSPMSGVAVGPPVALDTSYNDVEAVTMVAVSVSVLATVSVSVAVSRELEGQGVINSEAVSKLNPVPALFAIVVVPLPPLLPLPRSMRSPPEQGELSRLPYVWAVLVLSSFGGACDRCRSDRLDIRVGSECDLKATDSCAADSK